MTRPLLIIALFVAALVVGLIAWGILALEGPSYDAPRPSGDDRLAPRAASLV